MTPLPQRIPKEPGFDVTLLAPLLLFRCLVAFERVVVVLIIVAGVVQLFRSRLGMAVRARLAFLLGIIRLGIGQTEQTTTEDGNCNQTLNQPHSYSP
ncbi:hypothetical protein SBA2_30105 [Acidobacteriia bacterium SbA2]|nr:hypothetical protein SBA2_30105 [Acidobacteriia bacterium SbA2]